MFVLILLKLRDHIYLGENLCVQLFPLLYVDFWMQYIDIPLML